MDARSPEAGEPALRREPKRQIDRESAWKARLGRVSGHLTVMVGCVDAR
jgi:hypothetical protein